MSRLKPSDMLVLPISWKQYASNSAVTVYLLHLANIQLQSSISPNFSCVGLTEGTAEAPLATTSASHKFAQRQACHP